jgi:putative nucleotidyltransferase with HDIG domain
MEIEVKKIMEKVEEAGGEIYLVGGAVRDTLLKRKIKDWDLTTNLKPEKILEIFAKKSFYNNKFGTVGVIGKNNLIYEITTFRTDSDYTDNRHPDKITWGKSLKEDVERRDFTINAMAMDKQGKIYDFFDGQLDLKNKIVKAVGVADTRFKEDGLRMMRAIRIACQISFLIETETFDSILKNSSLIKNISSERIRDELFLILKSESPVEGVLLLKNSGLLKEIIPELLEGVGMEQKGHHIFDVFKHNIEALRNCESKNPVTRLACLLHDVGKPKSLYIRDGERTFHNHEVIGSRMAVKIGKRLKLSNIELDQLFKLVRWHMFTTSEMVTDKAVRRFIKNVTPVYLDEMIAVRRADRIGGGAKETSWRWELFKKRLIKVQKQPFSIKDLKINGEDVMKIKKIKPGREIGIILKKIFEMVEEDPKFNKREKLLKIIKDC